MICGVSVYALPVDGGGTGAVSRMDIIDYIILVGTAFFLIGIISVLLSVYLGIRKKSFKEMHYYDDEDYIYHDVEGEDEDLPVNAEVASDEEPEEEILAEEITNEELVPESEDDVAEPEEEYKVRITLTGMNNADVKIAEFASVATVGRRGTNDIMISDNAVSGSHCAFIYEDGTVYLKDCGSTNGTLLNGELIEKAEVRAGDIIIIGKYQYKLSITL